MRLSGLQKFILEKALEEKKRKIKKSDFYAFYKNEMIKKNRKGVQDAVHKSIENLIKKDLLVAYGRKTAQKWFITWVRLTNQGRRVIKEIIKKQQRKLPFK